jgi:inner membrane protein
MFGHRGITQSVAFAAAAAAACVFFLFRRDPPRLRARVGAVLLLAGLSHPLLDACMASGLGVALLAPFSAARFHSPLRPILVTPANENRFLDEGGIRVTNSEILWIWFPALTVLFAALRFRRKTKGRSAANPGV